MSVVGSSLMFPSGGGIPEILGFHIGNIGSSSIANVGSTFITADNNYFTVSNNNTFVCQKAGTYTVYYGGKSCYMNAGYRRDAVVYVYVNESSVANFTTSGTWFEVRTVQVTLGVGDTVAIKGKNAASSSNLEPLFMIVSHE